MMNNNYLASLTNPSEDDDDIKDTKPLKGGLASFQSGSYLDNLASSSLSNKGGKDGFSSSSTNRKKKFWSPPKSSAASSYLNALKGSASSVSPWDAASRHRNQPFGSMRPAPWKPDAGQPKFAAVPEPPRRDPMKTSRPAPWKPTAAGRPIVDPVSVPSAPITSREDSSRRPDAAFVPETSTAELRNVDLPSSDIPKNDDVASVVRTDRLDSTRIVYENLVGDILEEEGFIVSAPPVTKQPNAPTSATSRNEPVYLDTMMTQDEVEETLSSSSPPFNTYNTPAWADGPAVWKAESLSTSQPMIAAEPAPTQLTFLDDTVQGQLNAISDEASNDDIQDEKYMRMAIELATSA